MVVVANTVLAFWTKNRHDVMWSFKDMFYAGFQALFFYESSIRIEGLPSFSRKHDRARPISDPPKQCIVERQSNLTVSFLI